ncbi:MAG: T9SS C-terminal target domain-containing protein, partial [Calditrichaeota bacterium]
AASGAAATVPADPFFSNVDYYGAFHPTAPLWTDGWTAISQDRFTTDIVVNKSALAGIPTQYSLSQNYPNPFNPTTRIQFTLPSSESVKLTVYNALGQQVAILVDGYRPAGEYVVTWNALNLASGMYFYRLEAGSGVFMKKMILMK